MDALFALGVSVGLAVGAFLGYALTKHIVNRLAALGRARLVRASALVACLLVAVPVSFYALVLGGNFGGAGAAFLLGEWGISLGIGFGIAVAFGTCMVAAAILGASLGVLVSRALGKQHVA